MGVDWWRTPPPLCGKCHEPITGRKLKTVPGGFEHEYCSTGNKWPDGFVRAKVRAKSPNRPDKPH